MTIPRTELPLALAAEVETADGRRYPWGANRDAASRFRNLSFSTSIGEGFSDGGVQFSRDYNVDFPDIRLLNKVTFHGADGSVAYEGRISAIPREVGEGHTIGVTLAGLMANASDRKFTEIYVDREMSGWGDPSAARRASMLSINLSPVGPSQGHATGDTSVATITATVSDSWVSPYIPQCEAWYDAGSCRIGTVYAAWTRTGSTGSVAPWAWAIYLSDDDTLSVGVQNTSTVGAGPGALQIAATAATRRYAMLLFLYFGTPAGAPGAQYSLDWSLVTVYGTSGVATYTGEPGQPVGVRAADVIRDVVTRFCPQLHAGDIAADDYVIQHLAFKDGVTPFEAMQQVNKYSLRNLAVWESGRLDWTPFDLTDYDWQVRAGVDAAVSLQGPSTENVYNGIVVRYDDVLSGRKNTLTPDAYTELRDTSQANPWNQQGIQRWTELDLSYPHTQAGALQAGAAALADAIRAKSPGSITVTGYVRDRAGNRQPGWKVRAGDTVSVVNHPNDAPRLIHHTAWDDSAKTVTLSVDAPPSSLAAQQDRVQTALKARGLLG